jgi:hypothetical protein
MDLNKLYLSTIGSTYSKILPYTQLSSYTSLALTNLEASYMSICSSIISILEVQHCFDFTFLRTYTYKRENNIYVHILKGMISTLNLMKAVFPAS